MNLKDNECICPNCGKILKGRKYFHQELDYEDDISYQPHYVYHCKDCNIKASTIEYRLSDICAYTIPKNIVADITQKQIGYIKYLSTKFYDKLFYSPLFINKQVASNWITQIKKLEVEYTQEKLNIKNIKKIFNEHNFKIFKDDEDIITAYYDVDDNIYQRIYLYYYLLNNNLKMKIDFLTDVENQLLKLSEILIVICEEIDNIKNEIDTLEYPTEDEANNAIEMYRQEYLNYQKYCHAADYDDIDEFNFEDEQF